MVAWFVPSVLSQRVYPTTNLLPEDRWRICSSSWWSQSKDWDPSFFMETTFDFSSISTQMIRNLNFQHWANFLCFLESILSEWIFHHFDVTVIIGIIQHIQMPSNPCPGLSWNMVQEKSFSLKKYMRKALFTRMYFWIFESFVMAAQHFFVFWKIDGKWNRYDWHDIGFRDSDSSFISTNVSPRSGTRMI